MFGFNKLKSNYQGAKPSNQIIFDYTKARDAGLSDEQIFSHLQEQKNQGINIKIDEKEISNYNNPSSSQVTNKPSQLRSDLSKRGEELKQIISDTASGRITPVETGIQAVGKTIGVANDILGAGISAITPQFAKDGMSNIISSKPVQDIMSSYASWKKENPRAAKNLESVIDIASLIPIGKGATVAGQASKPLVSKGLQVSGGLGENAGKKLMGATLTPTEAQARKLTSYRATTPVPERLKQMSGMSESLAPTTIPDVALKYNLSGVTRGNIAVKAQRIANSLWENVVNPTLDSIKVKVNKTSLFNKIEQTISEIPDLTQMKSLQNAFNAIKNDYKGVTNWSIKELDNIKSSLATKLPNKVWKGEDISGNIANVRKIFSDEARTVVRNNLPDNVKTIYDEYGSLKELSRRGSKALSEGMNSGVLGLTSKAIQTMITPLTTIPGNIVGKSGTLLKRLGKKLSK